MPKKGNTAAGTLYLVHVLTHATRSRLDDALGPFGVSSFQFTVLSVIARNDGLSSAGLSQRFHVTPQAMGELVQLLERKGLIERKEDPKNRKILRLRLTVAGNEVWKATSAVVAAFEHTLFAGRTETDIAMLRSFISDALLTLREDKAS